MSDEVKECKVKQPRTVFRDLALFAISGALVFLIFRGYGNQTVNRTINHKRTERVIERQLAGENKIKESLIERTKTDTLGLASLNRSVSSLELEISRMRTGGDLVMLIEKQDTLIYALKSIVRMQDSTIITLRALDVSNNRIIAYKDTLLTISNDKADQFQADAKKFKRQRNITRGALAGLAAVTGYVIYNQATK